VLIWVNLGHRWQLRLDMKPNGSSTYPGRDAGQASNRSRAVPFHSRGPARTLPPPGRSDPILETSTQHDPLPVSRDPRAFDARRFHQPDLGLCLEPSFRIAREDRLFVLGNCFANQVEYKLADAGYRAEGGRLGQVYSIGSALQTVRWALHGDFSARHLIELEDGRWFNGHRAPLTIHGTRDQALGEFRATLEAVGQGLRSADVLIVILGVIERFRDMATGAIFNCLPQEMWRLRDTGRAEPGRDQQSEVRRGLSLLAGEVRAVNPRVRLILGVSPITQDGTYCDGDVLIANGRCKATLRSAAGEAVEDCRAAGITADYFPCYELGVLNPREKVFKEELPGQSCGRMVRGRFVRNVVVRTLLDAYAVQERTPLGP
jgi:hypothetical protein